jgi:hypothetical protein
MNPLLRTSQAIEEPKFSLQNIWIWADITTPNAAAFTQHIISPSRDSTADMFGGYSVDRPAYTSETAWSMSRWVI